MLATNNTFFLTEPVDSETYNKYNLILTLASQTQDYHLDILSEKIWDDLFTQTQYNLTEIARDVRKQISEDKAEPMDYGKL